MTRLCHLVPATLCVLSMSPGHPETLTVVGMTSTGCLEAPYELDHALVFSSVNFCYSSFLYTQ